MVEENIAKSTRRYIINLGGSTELKLKTKFKVSHLKNPYHSFKSNNFLIRKSIFSKIRFNENITSYGHEDTQLSLEFKKNKIKILQIDNVVYHDGIENNKKCF